MTSMSNMFLNVTLNHHDGAYFPGQEVGGLLDINVESKFNINSITVSVCGMGMVYYSAENRADEIKHHTRKENYVQEMKSLFHSKDINEGGKLLESGSHSFPFTFNLPEAIPSSFESPEGYVRYSIIAELEGINLPEQSVKILFTVNAILDLNMFPKVKNTASIWTSHDIYCFCLRRGGPLSAVLHIPRKGFVPGETIPLSAEINNLDRRPIICVKARLIQIIKYNHKHVTNKYKRTLAEATRGCIMPHESQFWLGESLQIPPVAASFLRYCKLMSMWYKLYFIICRSKTQETTLKLPITIGTVPLKQYVNTFDRGTGDAPLVGDDWPSPNNEPCFFGPHDIGSSKTDKVSVQQSMFSPQYVTYAAIQEDIDLTEESTFH